MASAYVVVKLPFIGVPTSILLSPGIRNQSNSRSRNTTEIRYGLHRGYPAATRYRPLSIAVHSREDSRLLYPPQNASFTAGPPRLDSVGTSMSAMAVSLFSNPVIWRFSNSATWRFGHTAKQQSSCLSWWKTLWLFRLHSRPPGEQPNCLPFSPWIPISRQCRIQGPFLSLDSSNPSPLLPCHRLLQWIGQVPFRSLLCIRLSWHGGAMGLSLSRARQAAMRPCDIIAPAIAFIPVIVLPGKRMAPGRLVT